MIANKMSSKENIRKCGQLCKDFKKTINQFFIFVFIRQTILISPDKAR